MDKQITTCFLFSAQLLGGGEILRLSGSGAGQSVDLVRLLYIIRLYLSLLFRRQAGIEYNYMLCIIASSYFFFWRKCSTVVVVGVQTSFFAILQKVWQKKNNSRVDVRRQAKRLCKPRFDRLSDRQAQRSVKSADLEIRGGDFWRLGIALRSCPLLTYRRSLTAFFILLCMIYYYWIQLMSKHCNTWFTLSNLRFGLFYWLTIYNLIENSICNTPLLSGCIVYKNIIII